MVKKVNDVDGPWSDIRRNHPSVSNKNLLDQLHEFSSLCEIGSKVTDGIVGKIVRFKTLQDDAFYRIENEYPLELAFIPFYNREGISDLMIENLTDADIMDAVAREDYIYKTIIGTRPQFPQRNSEVS